MKDIIKSVSKLAIPNILNLVSSLLKNKIIALLIGPSGLGIYSQFLNILGLFVSVLPVGAMGLVRYISNMHIDGRNNEINYLIRYFLIRNLVLSIITSLILVLFSNAISSFLFSNSTYSPLIKIFSIVIPIIMVLNIIDIYLKSIRNINKYVLFLSLNSLLSTIITVPLIFKWEITGAVAAIIISAILNLIVGFSILKKYNLFSLPVKYEKVKKDVIKNIYGLGIAVLISMIIQNLTFLVIKSIIANKLGLNSVGIFQCVFSISTSYFGIFFVVVGTYSIPKISAMKSNIEISNEMNSTFRFLLMVYLPILILVFSLRSFIIPLLYSNDFVTAKELLIFQLPAEFIRAFSWTAGIWMIPKLYFSKWLLFEIIFYSLFLLSFVIMIYYFNFSVNSASISYLFAYCIFFIINYIYAIIKIKFTISKLVIKQSIITIALLIFTLAVSFINENLGYGAAVISIIVWSIFSLTKDEILKAKEIFIRKTI